MYEKSPKQEAIFSLKQFQRQKEAHILVNGASDIIEIEKAASLGLGLKKPLFETANEIGIQKIVDELKKLAQQHGTFYEPDPLLVSMC
jgi:enoyl-CoA hydratase/3-hydroxyacyl-CoA dehydrogenase